MSCNSCKKRKFDNLITQHEEYQERFGSKVVWFVVIWSLFGLYGFVSLLMKLI